MLTVLAALSVSVAISPAHAQGMRTATGQNPLERISGADYGGNGALGRTNVAPSYSSRAGLQQVRGGQYSLGYYWTPQLNGNGVDRARGRTAWTTGTTRSSIPTSAPRAGSWATGRRTRPAARLAPARPWSP